ncbi:hypothetical protein A3860_38610 [Niastella vici]|uniref:Peptidase M56 domain-containing protein n=1 Tax=Niastella vici TaxID=1703345 RepID=A0A1V9FLA9_9BACT|nr:M56 family metallopeptidase [Niastella vici]OQP59153.1 hypothetical protein A3860_38610 [Niastella vici]
MLQYLLKLSISLSIVYLFYQLFLRRLTFYNWNRWYLLIYSMVCFVIPVINVFTIIIKEPALRESAIINYIPAITQMAAERDAATVTTPSAGIDWLLVSALVFITGMLLMAARLLVQYYSLYKMRTKAVLLYDDKVKLYHIDEPVMPFSFGRGIYVNQHQHSEHELKEIIRHEFIHVKQRHSLDIIWSELLCILNWYNPFAWLLRHDIRQNLEFIADQHVLQTGLDRKEYQYLLLKVIGVNSFSIATNFNFSSLKRRIAMMNKTKSARVHLLRFLFLLPLLIVVLLAFRNATHKQQQQPLRSPVNDTIPLNSEVWKKVLTIDVNDVNGAKKVTIRTTGGKVETYDLTVPKEKEAFEKKYGQLPKPPAPPAPPTAAVNGDNELAPPQPDAPELAEIAELPEKPEAPEKPELAELPEKPEAPEIAEAPQVPVPPPPPTPIPVDCLNKKGYCITVVDNYGECIVIVKDNKSKKILEAITLTDWNKDKQYEDKYGEIPPRKVMIRLHTKPVTKVDVKPVTSLKPAPRVNLDNFRIERVNLKKDTLVNVKPVTVVTVKELQYAKVENNVKVERLAQVKTTVNPTVVILEPVKVTSSTKVKAATEPAPAAKPVPANPEKDQ